MDVKKFGGMIAALGAIFGVMAFYHFMKRRIVEQDPAYINAIVESVALGYSTKLADFHIQVAQLDRMSYWFGIAAAVTIFIGLTLYMSAKSQVTLDTSRLSTGMAKKCPFCAELIMTDALICKHCGKDQPVQEVNPASAETWECQGCTAINDNDKKQCWNCEKMRPS
jgi:RNA polymerase subunit RPABC4/transcription elongation factor Spt4